MRDVLASGLQVAGGAGVVAAAFLASPVAGLAALSVAVLLLGVGLER
jgi:hypothetical protein